MIENQEKVFGLVEPSLKYKDSYLAALREFHQEGWHPEQTKQELEANFEAFVQDLKDQSVGVNLKPGRVPQTTYWIVDQDGFVGRVSVRHELNEHLLKVGGHIGYDIRPSKRQLGYGTKALQLALPKARALGLKKVLITCDSTNIGSKKIIEANGGVLENEVEDEPGKPSKLRYWVTL